MRCRFAFSQTSDGRLLVTMEALWGFAPGLNGTFCVLAIDDENTFIQHIVLADFAKEETIDLIAGVLLVVSGLKPAVHWVAVTLNQLQLTALGMHLVPDEKAEPEVRHPLGFVDEEDLARVFMQAPTPVCMLSGTEHVFTFINPAYLRLLGRNAEDVLGKPVREALTDLEGQPFFGLLDNVYKTGEPFVGVEVPVKFNHNELKPNRETYVDFVYHPVRDSHDKVCGILCQASDVTERVLEMHVRESREEQLYRQWAEMEAIYRESPVAMCLLEAKTFKILRLNKVKAQMLGDTIENLIGKIATDLPLELSSITLKYVEVLNTKQPAKFEVEMEIPGQAGKPRFYLWNLNPVISSAGQVESIASVVVDVTDRPARLVAETSAAQTASV